MSSNLAATVSAVIPYAKRYGLGVVAGIIALNLASHSTTYVEQGQVGLIVDTFTGQIIETANPGYHVVMPVGRRLVTFPAIRQQYVMVREKEGQHTEDDSVAVNSKEGQAFNVDVSVEYELINKEAAAGLYRRYGMQFDSIVEKYYRSKFKAAVVGAFAGLPLAEGITGDGRANVSRVATETVRAAMLDDNIKVDQLLIRAVYVPEAISNSIAAKTKAENDLVKSRTEAQKMVVEAKAKADAAIAAAEGDAKAMTLRATAEAEANNKIAASLTSPILRKLAIEKFNPNVKLVVPNNAFVNFANGEITGDK